MKKLLLVLAMTFTMLFAVNTETEAQSALYVQGGYSWLEGVVSVGGQVGYWGGMIGYFPAKMPGDGTTVAGICWDITWYNSKWYESGMYASIGMNSAGYRYQASYNGGSWTDNVVEPMWIGMLGYKYGSDLLYLKGGVGYGWNSHATAFTYEITIGFAIGN